MPNYFAILELDPTSQNVTEDDIKKAYRKLAKQWHPDKAIDKDKTLADIKFKAINEAYVYLLANPQYVPGNEKELNALYDIKQSIKQWPEEDQHTANQYLQDPEVVRNFILWIKREELTSIQFLKPVRPLFWEILSNSEYTTYCPNESHKVIQPVMEATMNQGYSQDYRACPYMFKFKWKIFKESLDCHIRNNTEETYHAVRNARLVFHSGDVSSCNYYRHTVYNNFVSPLEKKMKKLRDKQDRISIEKADQLQLALNEIENRFGQSIESFLNNHKHQILDRPEITVQTHELHRIFIDTVNVFSKAEKINKRNNLIGDVLRGALGVLLATITLGIPLYSQRFMNTFFYVDTKVKLNEAKDNVHDEMYEWHQINKWKPSMRG
ncbi:MAG: DnaJ domain-containing protein [Candidatus Babeliales bacterium]|nr:DnaJ domain-containing protein [Candidatus Babeliales bacterium]